MLPNYFNRNESNWSLFIHHFSLESALTSRNMRNNWSGSSFRDVSWGQALDLVFRSMI